MLPIVEEFMELVRISVQSRDERAIADCLTAKLRVLGFEVAEDGAGKMVGGNTGNIIGRLKGAANVPPVILSAHMDRVKNNGSIHPVVNGDTITSDGTTILAADDVAGIAVILDGVRLALAEGIPHGDIEVVFSICEEQGVLGSRYLDYSLLSAKMAFVFDAAGKVGRIVNQAPTKCKIKVGVHGKNAHAGNEPEKGLNAIKVAAKALAQMPEGRLSKASTANFGIIQGGSSTNVVCDFVEIVGEARSTNAQELEAYLVRMRQIFADVAAECKTEIDVNIEKLYDTFYLPEDSVPAQIVTAALSKLGIDTKFTPGGGGMDANQFNSHGIEALGVAAGYARNHTVHEEVSIAELITGAKAVREIIHEIYVSAKQK